VATQSFRNLKELRTGLLGFGFHSVSRLAGIPAPRLHAIEDEGASPTVAEIESLARVYGIDSDNLCDEPIALLEGDSIQLLTCAEELVDLADPARARIVAAASAARDLRRLQKLDGQPRASRDGWMKLGPADKQAPPHRQGAALAASLRSELGLDTEPIDSVRDLVRVVMPGAEILYVSMTADGPAGITLADSVRGPAIVLNLDGRNRNPAVRRFSLAHEMVHLLIDWQYAEPLAIVSGFFSDSSLEREQRANAFAVRLLCPEAVLRTLRYDDPVAAARLLLEYGLHYGAARLYLRNELGHTLPRVPPPELGIVGTQAWLERAESPEGLAGFPEESVPPERRTAVAFTASRCYSEGKIPRDAFAEMLGVTPAHDLEAVLDWFALPAPQLGERVA